MTDFKVAAPRPEHLICIQEHRETYLISRHSDSALCARHPDITLTAPSPSATVTVHTSAQDAWAVGALGTLPVSKTVIVHWNGKTWTKVPSPSPPQSGLADVAATSADNAWAVGTYGITHPKTLILHWNGTAWK